MRHSLSLWATAGLAFGLAVCGCDTWKDPPLPGPRLDERNAALEEARNHLPRVEQAEPSAAIDYLQSKNVWLRRAAADRLGALAPLASNEASSDVAGTDEDRSTDPIQVKAQAPSSSPAIDALIGALKDDDWRVRMKAGTALGAYADPSSIEPLIDTLVDPDRKVRLWAWKALRRLGEPAWTRMYERFAPEPDGKELAFTDESGIRRNLQEIMRGNLMILGKQGLSVAGQMLAHPLSEVRRAAAQVLAEIGLDAQEATPDLIGATQHQDLETRLAAIRALAKIGEADSDILPTLDALAKDEDKKVADEAKKALAEIKNAAKQKDDEKKDKAKKDKEKKDKAKRPGKAK